MGRSLQQSTRLGHVFPVDTQKKQNGNLVAFEVNNKTKMEFEPVKKKKKKLRQRWCHSICKLLMHILPGLGFIIS